MVSNKPFARGPLDADLGVLGQRWTLVILADIGFRKTKRFSLLLKSNAGLTPRMLSRRLKELEQRRIIEKQSSSKQKTIEWKLTNKGRDLLPAVMNLIAFGAKWNTDKVFGGRLPKMRAKDPDES